MADPADVVWSNDPPWSQQPGGMDGERECVRCGETMPQYWRHYWPPCRRCRVWSFAGVCFLAACGLNGRPWMYWGARYWCDDCDGTGYLPCQPQDMSVLRRSGACQTCGAYSFVLMHATNEQHGEIEGSARHYDDEADHEVVVGSAPLTRALNETRGRAEPWR